MAGCVGVYRLACIWMALIFAESWLFAVCVWCYYRCWFRILCFDLISPFMFCRFVSCVHILHHWLCQRIVLRASGWHRFLPNLDCLQCVCDVLVGVGVEHFALIWFPRSCFVDLCLACILFTAGCVSVSYCVHLDGIGFCRILIVCSVCVMLCSVLVSNILLWFDFPVLVL